MATFPIFNPPDEPPAYDHQTRRRADSATSTSSTATYKRVKDMTPEERLASLQEWAEEQKYFRPGEGGTFGYGAFSSSSVYRGPVRFTEPSYQGWIAPPSYESAQTNGANEDAEGKEESEGKLKKWLKKRKERKYSRSQSTPEIRR